MARRKTAEEHQAIIDKRMEELEATAAEYPARLMRVLETATRRFGMDLTVIDGRFNLDQRGFSLYRLSLIYDANSAMELDGLEYDLVKLQCKLDEQQHLIDLQKTARAKLTSEELRALGL